MELLKKGRIVVYDIETTDFKADFGHMLMWAAKDIDSDYVYYDRIDDNEDYGETPESMMDDSHIVRSLIDFLTGADIQVGHYASGFDLKFMNTRAIKHDIPPLQPIPMIDTWRVLKDNLALRSNSLKNGAEFFGGPQKGGLSKSQWALAIHGHKTTLNDMLDYNIDDVLATENVYLKTRPLIKNHPFAGAFSAGLADEAWSYVCPACASTTVQRRGVRRTRCFAIRRLQCQSCGLWFDGRRSKIG